MKKLMKAVAALMLMTVVVCIAGCTKPDGPNNGENGGNNNGGGNNGGGNGGSINGFEYVDLGLPSGTLWATCNVGATTPEGYGDYFAWGDTQPKYYYDWITYKYANGTSWENPQLIKYCNNSSYGYNGFTDHLTTLLSEDDAATANWGADWRTPTHEEWRELYDYCTSVRMTLNGVKGCLFAASNGNSLFLPAAGSRWHDGFEGGAGSTGYYWSSSLNTDYPTCAWYLHFSSDGASVRRGSRFFGFSVRPVLEN